MHSIILESRECEGTRTVSLLLRRRGHKIPSKMKKLKAASFFTLEGD